MKRTLAVMAWLAMSSGGAQAPTPGFSLQSDRSFAPGSPVTVQLTAQNIDQIELRLYRVNDPAALFRQLPDFNSFGGAAPAVPPPRTPLERLARWKSRVRYAMRRLMHDQFGDAERATVQGWLGRKTPPAARKGTVTDYAEVPLLNPQQLVRTWRVGLGKSRQPWEAETVKFAVPGSGLYIVEGVGQGLRAATLVSVTPWALIQKSAPGRVVAQLVDRNSGQPVSGVPVTLIERGRDAGTAATDASGLAEIPLSGPGANDLLLLAQRQPDAAMVTVGRWAVDRRDEEFSAGYIYTDRPIYRPGDAVGYRGILRAEDERDWKLPGVAEVDVELQGPAGETVDRRRAKVSRYGTVAGDWKIPRDAALGYYTVVFRAGDSAAAGSFQVEEYRKPEYEVTVRPGNARILQGQVAEFRIEARYFFGEPVAGAKVAYTVRRSRARQWFSADFDPADWADEGDVPDQYGEVVLESSGRLNLQGQLVITLPAPIQAHDAEYQLTAVVTDAARREVRGSGRVLATVGTYALQAIPDKYVYAPAETASIRVEAWNYDRTPRAGAPVELVMGNTRTQGTTDAEGRAVLRASVSGTQTMTAEVTSRTPEGRTIRESVKLWVASGYLYDEERTSVEIVPDRKSYRPGDTARLLVVTGVENATVLMAVECRGLLRREVVRVPGTSFIYELPVTADHMPNVFVTAAFLKNGRYYFGSRSVKVPTDRILDVKLTPAKAEFKPGEPASYVVEARDATGRPVQGEFSLGVVDEAVYGVEPDRTLPIAQAFHGPRYDRVYTSSSLSFYFFGQAGRRAMVIAGAEAGRRSRLAQVKPPRVVDPRVRRDFRDTALWLADVETDAAGRAQVRLQFPDSLTAWRATARGVTVDTKVGAAVNRVVTRKDLILRTVAPRFLRAGDEVTVSAILNNYLPGERTAKVTLAAEGLELLDGGERSGIALAQAETAFDFRLRAGSVPVGKLMVKAFAEGDADAMEIELPIRPFGVRVSQSWSGTLEGPLEQTVAFPGGASGRSIDVRTLPSLAGAIFGGLEYLTSYPYGCTEQTLSSFVPNAIVQRAFRELKLPVRDPARVDRQTQAGLARLADFQHPDGGWGFGGADDSNAFMTASVVAALDDLGTWEPVRRDAARAWLRRAWERETRTTPDFRAFLAHALNEPAALKAVWNSRSQLSPYGQALLGLRGDPEQAQAMAAALEQAATVAGEEAHWKAERDAAMDIEVDASAEVTAMAVKLLAKVKPDSALIPKAARWLLNHRNEGYYWTSTKQTAAVIGALTEFVKRSGELNPKLAVEVRSNGELVWNKELLQADALSPHPAGVRVLPKGDSSRIGITASGQGKLYWSITAEHYDPAPRLEGRRGLQLERQYLRQLPGGGMAAFDGQARPGDTIVSRLTLTARGGRWLVVEDPIAAGAEWVREDRFDVRELRDDRAVLLIPALDGVRTIETRMKVVRPGVFRISPARVAPMYQPGEMAATGGARWEVRP